MYFSTFIPGLGEVVTQQLTKALKRYTVQLTLDGLVVYQSNDGPDIVKKLSFLNNSFLLLGAFKGKSNKEVLNNLSGDKRWLEKVSSFVKGRKPKYRVIISKENQMVSVEKGLQNRLERTLETVKGLVIDRRKPDIEFWVLLRSEGYEFFGLRITKHPDYADVLEKGELRPELATLLCLLSDPNPNDVFLDPFAGFGAIPVARASLGLSKAILASDNDPQKVKYLSTKFQKLKLGLKAVQVDTTNLNNIKDSSINKIVTDPPWGSFQDIGNLAELYKGFLEEAARVLVPNGILVVLTGAKEVFEEAFKGTANTLTLENKYDILVSGKKAAIYYLVKKI